MRQKSGGTTLFLFEQSGQLGNRLFPYAHLMAFAIEHGCRIINTGFRRYRHLFEGSSRGLTAVFPASPLPSVPHTLQKTLLGIEDELVKRLVRSPKVRALLEPRGMIREFPPVEFIDLDSEQTAQALTAKRLMLLRGWQLRGYELAKKHREAIRAYFRPAGEVVPRVDRLVRELREKHDAIIGVHIRHGDYFECFDGDYFFTHGEFVARMRSLANILRAQSPCFLVCSNEPIPSDAFAGLPFLPGPGDIAGDLHALSLCDYLMGPPSTYSAWASYYGDVPLHVMRQREWVTPQPGDFKVFEEIELLYTDTRCERSTANKMR